MKTKYKKPLHWQTVLVAPKCIYCQRRTSRAEARCECGNVIEDLGEDVDLYDVLIHRTVLEETRRRGGTRQNSRRNGNEYRCGLVLNFDSERISHMNLRQTTVPDGPTPYFSKESQYHT